MNKSIFANSYFSRNNNNNNSYKRILPNSKPLKTGRDNYRKHILQRGISPRFFKVPEKGINSAGGYKEFIEKDVVKPYSNHYLGEEIRYKNGTGWALNYTKICPRVENLPKYQQFKSYNFFSFPKGNSAPENESSLSRELNKTMDQCHSKRQNSYLDMKQSFNKNSYSKSDYDIDGSRSRSLMNKSSVCYNIINHSLNKQKIKETNCNNLSAKNRFKRIGYFNESISYNHVHKQNEYQKSYRKFPCLFNQLLTL